MLRAAYSWAVSEGILKDNPAASIKVDQPGHRDTIMAGSEDYARLFNTLVQMENELRIRQPVADAIRFIALTGARKGEVVSMTWSYVDQSAGQVSIPPNKHKTGGRTGKPPCPLPRKRSSRGNLTAIPLTTFSYRPRAMASFRWRNPGARFEKRQVYRPHWACMAYGTRSHLTWRWTVPRLPN